MKPFVQRLRNHYKYNFNTDKTRVSLIYIGKSLNRLTFDLPMGFKTPLSRLTILNRLRFFHIILHNEDHYHKSFSRNLKFNFQTS